MSKPIPNDQRKPPKPSLSISVSTRSKSRSATKPIKLTQCLRDIHIPVSKALNLHDSAEKAETLMSTACNLKGSPKSLNTLPSRKLNTLECVNEVPEKPVQPSQDAVKEICSRHELIDMKPDSIFDEKLDIKDHTCPICYGDYDKEEVTVPLSCGHVFCQSCIVQFLKKQIDEFHVLKIKCPQDKCSCFFTDNEIQSALDKEAFELYQYRKLLKLRNQDILLRYCPKPGCTKPFYPDANRMFTQCECGTMICHNCFHQKHDGKTCLEAASGEYELYSDSVDYKKCIICKTIMDKKEGCSHVVCPVCDYEWCWHCGREWEPGHGSRCLNKWNPIEPRAFRKKDKKSIIDEICNLTFLMFEIIIYGLSAALGVLLVWPCIMITEFQNLLPKSIKSKNIRLTLGVTAAVLTWAPAIFVYPIFAVMEEYGTCCRKRRWLKGTSANFGFTQKIENGREKFRFGVGRRASTVTDDFKTIRTNVGPLKVAEGANNIVYKELFAKEKNISSQQMLQNQRHKPELEIIVSGKSPLMRLDTNDMFSP